MRMLRRACLGALACLAIAAVPASAQLSTTTDTFVVSITVQNECTVTVNDMDFGPVTSLVSAVSASTTAAVTCTGVGPITLSFDVGTGGGDFDGRLMVSGSDTIEYNLYRDASHTEILGSGDSGPQVIIDDTSSGGTDTFTLYGLTTPGQGAKPVGTYTSTITATLTY